MLLDGLLRAMAWLSLRDEHAANTRFVQTGLPHRVAEAFQARQTVNVACEHLDSDDGRTAQRAVHMLSRASTAMSDYAAGLGTQQAPGHFVDAPLEESMLVGHE